MVEKYLNLNQMLALLPATIPDSILDFLDDFNHHNSLEKDSVRESFDQEYFKNSGDTIRAELAKLRKNGKILQLHIENCTREIPGGFIAKMKMEQGMRGIGFLTKLKEKTILRMIFIDAEYDEAKFKEYLKNPPKEG